MRDRRWILGWRLVAALSLPLPLALAGCSEDPEPRMEAAPERLEEPAVAPEAQARAPQLAPGEQLVPGSLTGTVRETMNSGGYTYMRVEEGARSNWVAALQMEVAEGDRVEVSGGSAIQGFHSRTLNREFDTIIFASRARVLGEGNTAAPAAPTPGALPPGHPPLGGQPPTGGAPPAGHPSGAHAPSGDAPIGAHPADG